jgi:hypothetical protein
MIHPQTLLPLHSGAKLPDAQGWFFTIFSFSHPVRFLRASLPRIVRFEMLPSMPGEIFGWLGE